MRLALSIYHYFPYGGLQKDFLNIARAFQKRGHQTVIYTTHWEGASCDFPATIHFITPKGKSNYRRMESFSNKLQTVIGSHDCVLGFNRTEGLDVYFAGDECYRASLASKPTLLRKFSRAKTYLALEEKAVSNSHVLFLTQKQKEVYQHYYSINDSRGYVLPPILDSKPSSKPIDHLSMKQSLKLNPDLFSLLFVGSCFRTKGLDFVLRALHDLPKSLTDSVRLYVAGNQKAKRFYHLAKLLNIHHLVHFLGPCDNIDRWMSACDLLVHPARHEAGGKVLLEAMACGLPILTTANCGYSSIVKDADAGTVLEAPLIQETFNQALEKFLTKKFLHKQGERGRMHIGQMNTDMPNAVVNYVEEKFNP